MTDGLMRRTWEASRFHWRQSLGFHLMLQLLGIALLTPLITGVGRLLVRASGGPVISNYDMVAFGLSPIGVAFILVVAALTITLLLAEFTGQNWIAGHAVARRPVTVSSTIAFLRRQASLADDAVGAGVPAARAAGPAVPGGGRAGVVHDAARPRHQLLPAPSTPEWRRAKVLVVVLGTGYALAATWQLARWLLAIPILTYKGARPGQALRDSAEMTHGRLRRIVPPLVIWWLLVTVTALGIAWLARQVSDAGLDWAGIDVRRVLPLVALFVMMAGTGTFLYSAVHLAGQQFLVTRMYAEQVDAAKWRVPATLEIGEQLARPMARRVILTSLALLALSLTVAWMVAARLDLERVVAVTAHRGAKVTDPENTLAAFKAAMEAGATFIELDVQHTRDGQIVVLHDADFMRMGSDPRKIAALTGAEVATIDIGRKYDPKFTGEHAPTLEEVIDLVRGQMKINVELKYNVPDSTLAPAVVDLLRRKDFLDQVVITSLDYGALRLPSAPIPRSSIA